MNLVAIAFIIGTLLTIVMESSLSLSLSIPYNERKSWIRAKRDDKQSGSVSIMKGACALEREEKRRIALRIRSSEFIPQCRRDGSYFAVQCHSSTKSCWCVTESGRPIPGTSILYSTSSPSSSSSSSPNILKRPNCAKYNNRRAKSATKRRSSQGRKNRKSCNYGDRSRFNAALIKSFRGEFDRIRMFSGNPYSKSGSTETGGDDEVLSWKFDYLDKNKDSFLERNETSILKRLVKQQIQPRQCAKTFISFCANGDKRITKKEWLDCLTAGGSAVENRSTSMHPSQLLRPAGPSSSSGGRTVPIHPNSNKGSEVSEVSNCWTDRQSALASQKLGSNESVIIPECTPTGLYQRTQCAQGKAYCWCVFEETGQQIPQTVVIDSTPDCDKRVAAFKSMKGCSGPKKIKFLLDLMESFANNMNNAMHPGSKRSPGDLQSMSLQEQLARWNYNRLDANHNGILDRREWKTFRNETSSDKKLKRCGKKMPRFCDANQDKKITLTEWLVCLNIKSSESVQSSARKPVHRSMGQRSGKNPFTTILKQR